MSNTDAIRVLLAGRSSMYRLCQIVLGNEPSKEMLEQLVSDSAQQVFLLFDDGQEEFLKATQTLRVKSTEFLNGGEGALDKLIDAFTGLFVGPGMPEAPPWESYYLNTHHTLFEKTTLEVRIAYVDQGLLPAAYPHVADDHIGIELDFLARLAERAEASYEKGDTTAVKGALSASKAFIKEHLAKWVPDFMAMLAKTKHSDLYLETATLLVSFLSVDLEALNELQIALEE
jgi:TorA maturation chaperone TorD